MITRHRNTGLLMRPGTMDGYVIGERRGYLALGPRPDDVLLDVGGNIGAVAHEFAAAGCRVVTVEPEPDNYQLLEANTAPMAERVTAVRAAVVDQHPPSRSVPLYCNTAGKNKATHTLVATRGRTAVAVATVTLAELFDRHRPTLLKIDIEGGEYALAPTLRHLPAYVRAIAMELHLNRKTWRTEQAPALAQAITDQGFAAVRAPRIGEKNWHTLAVWSR